MGDRGTLGNLSFNEGVKAGERDAGNKDAQIASEIAAALTFDNDKDYRDGYNKGVQRGEDKPA